jgi:GAF domain-containing protein
MQSSGVEYPEDREACYAQVVAEIASIVTGEPNLTARMASAACVLAQAFGPRFFWTGFYMVDADKGDELVVGPYQGTLGCLRIGFGKGVVGGCAARGETIVVDDVDAFPGHIACDSRSKSEIVVPVFAVDGVLIAVLDVDSDQPAAFDERDARGLEAFVAAMMTG